MKKILLCGIILVTCLSACGPIVRVKIIGTKDGVTVNTSQTTNDSTGLHISVNPNIQL